MYYTQTALQQRNKDFYTLMQMFHYIDTEQWDAIISSADLNYNNYLHLNCLNLALSHKGVMQTDLFKYRGKFPIQPDILPCRNHVLGIQFRFWYLGRNYIRQSRHDQIINKIPFDIRTVSRSREVYIIIGKDMGLSRMGLLATKVLI